MTKHYITGKTDNVEQLKMLEYIYEIKYNKVWHVKLSHITSQSTLVRIYFMCTLHLNCLTYILIKSDPAHFCICL